MEEQNRQEMSDAALARRDFLRKSVYAACATPVIMSLLVERADAAQSWGPHRDKGNANYNNPGKGQGGPPGGAPNNNNGQGPQNRGW